MESVKASDTPRKRVRRFQLTWQSSQGQLTLGNLRLKKGALDKFRLPVDVLEGKNSFVMIVDLS